MKKKISNMMKRVAAKEFPLNEEMTEEEQRVTLQLRHMTVKTAKKMWYNTPAPDRGKIRENIERKLNG